MADFSTPQGEWQAIERDGDLTGEIAIGDGLMRQSIGIVSQARSEWRANACAFAAAPTLISACQEAHALLYHYQLSREPNGVDWGPVEMLRQEMIDKLWHAITLAVPALKQGSAK